MSTAYSFDMSISSAVSRAGRRPTTIGPTATEGQEGAVVGPLAPALLDQVERYWHAANYLTVAQIYLLDNPLLREPLRQEHIKPRLLGHWGTSPGLSLIYIHLNRLINERGANVIYLTGPGHGGPALVALAYLEGTYSTVYPEVTQDLAGLQLLCRRFSTPGGIPSHVSAPTPGSIHEGGELGYVLSHAFGAAFDNPDLIVAAVVGDGEAESGPLACAWKSTSFLNPARDGAVLPILHLNGYKISGPTVLGRDSDDDIEGLLRGNGYEVHFVEGDDPERVHQTFAATLDRCYERIRAIQREAREQGVFQRPRWPAIVLRTPKGWTGPKVVGGHPTEGTFRSHQVPLADVRKDPEQFAQLEEWLRSYRPDELFDAEGKFVRDLAALAPSGDRRMSANPHANGGKLLVDLDIPDFRDYALEVEHPGSEWHESTRQFGKMLRDIYLRNAEARNFRLFCPDETN
ncbi:MAG TPA: phosphoketolase family protein, partial [Ktedonobacterales bacterium]